MSRPTVREQWRKVRETMPPGADEATVKTYRAMFHLGACAAVVAIGRPPYGGGPADYEAWAEAFDRTARELLSYTETPDVAEGDDG